MLGNRLRRDRPYDDIINLGSYCQSAYQLGVHNLRRYALPFDYLVTPFDTLAAILEQKFAGFLDPANFTLNLENGLIEDARHRTQLLHDFKVDDTFLNDYESISEKYQRRIDRLFGILESSRKVIFIRTEMWRQHAVELDATLGRLYPHLEYLLVAMHGTDEVKDDWCLPRVRNFHLRQLEPYHWHGDDEAWKEIFAELGLDSTACEGLATED
jgi:hypothetical protein